MYTERVVKKFRNLESISLSLYTPNTVAMGECEMRSIRPSKSFVVALSILALPAFLFISFVSLKFLGLPWFGHMISCVDAIGSTANCGAAQQAANTEDTIHYVCLFIVSGLMSAALGVCLHRATRG